MSGLDLADRESSVLGGHQGWKFNDLALIAGLEKSKKKASKKKRGSFHTRRRVNDRRQRSDIGRLFKPHTRFTTQEPAYDNIAFGFNMPDMQRQR